uniref:EF-hand domain-containing protein n=1 Tax=Phaeomonas parva TaxID=124430 RepID=A0A7S1U1D4_9STRA|mmetsp:Transcript_27211/g.85651  ORF Transcript_27211/g.85651 Transcript_27211/m.85651 type:complete len:120 (+) Transcript_27211:145-504(+)
MAAVDGVPAAAPLEQPIPNEFREEWAGKIREAFNLFDKERKGVVIVEEVGTIMRYIGAYPSERGLVSEILPAMQVGAMIGTRGWLGGWRRIHIGPGKASGAIVWRPPARPIPPATTPHS